MHKLQSQIYKINLLFFKTLPIHNSTHTHTPGCCVAATVVCAVRWCSAAGLVSGAASADGTLSRAGWAPTVEVASGPMEQTVSELANKKQDFKFFSQFSQLCFWVPLEHSGTNRSCPKTLLANQKVLNECLREKN